MEAMGVIPKNVKGQMSQNFARGMHYLERHLEKSPVNCKVFGHGTWSDWSMKWKWKPVLIMVCATPKEKVLCRFGLKMGIDFAQFSL